MKFCEECGAQLEDNALFCEECGTPVEPAESAQESGNEAGTVQSSEEAVKDESKTTADQVQESAGMPQNITPPQKEKKKGAMAGGVIAGVVIVAAIVVAALFQGGYLGKKTDAPQKEMSDNASAQKEQSDASKQSDTSKQSGTSEQSDTSERSASQEPQPTADGKKDSDDSELSKKWNGTYVMKDDSAVERVQIIFHSQKDIEMEYALDLYEEGVYISKLKGNLSTPERIDITDDDGSGISYIQLTNNDSDDDMLFLAKKDNTAAQLPRSDQYIIVDSSDRKLTESDVKGLSSDELRLARNEIYARHGRMFDDIELQQYFYNTDWYIAYQEANQFDENKELSKIEKYNVKFISKYE